MKQLSYLQTVANHLNLAQLIQIIIIQPNKTNQTIYKMLMFIDQSIYSIISIKICKLNSKIYFTVSCKLKKLSK